MKYDISKFSVDVIRTDYVPDIPGSWTKEEYQQVLEACEFDWLMDITDDELPDFAVISLLDYSPEEAAQIVLKIKLGDRLGHGQIKHLAYEMQEEKTWEEHADMSLHEKLFQCHVLLYQAFPKDFPEAETMRCILEITPQNGFAKEQLSQVNKSLLARVLADGMDEHSILNRLFEDELRKGPFQEAEHIVWQYNLVPASGGSFRVQVYSSGYWLTPILEVTEYASAAFADRQLQPA
ncbi:MAG: hypothetical protein Roseis2KO_07020 [Roseivirga sp.]